tara:strand:+ start:794 stop:3154 length:2361 start_codon:yes stop_codon:yes gene_type:complete
MTHARGHRGKRKDRYRKQPAPPVVEHFDDQFIDQSPRGYTIKNQAVIDQIIRRRSDREAYGLGIRRPPNMQGGGRDSSDISRHEVDPERDWAGRLRAHELESPFPQPGINATVTEGGPPAGQDYYDRLTEEAIVRHEDRQRDPFLKSLINQPDTYAGLVGGSEIDLFGGLASKYIESIYDSPIAESLEQAEKTAADQNLKVTVDEAKQWFNRHQADGEGQKRAETEPIGGSGQTTYYTVPNPDQKSYTIGGRVFWINKSRWVEADAYMKQIAEAETVSVKKNAEFVESGVMGGQSGVLPDYIAEIEYGDGTPEIRPERDSFGRVILPPDSDAVLERPGDWEDTIKVGDKDAEAEADEKVDADTTVAAVELKGNYGDGVVNPIRRSAYKSTSDPDFEAPATDEQNAAYIIQKVFGLAEGSKRQDPYTGEILSDAFTHFNWSNHDWEGNPPGEIDLNPPYLQEGIDEGYQEAMDTRGGPFNMAYEGEHKPAIVEWAVDILKSQYGYSDQELDDLMNAGWAYYNYTAEELAGGGSGPEVPKSPVTTPSEPGTLGNGDNIAGNDGNQAGEAKGWARDFRVHVAKGSNILPLAGEAPDWWEGYLPQEVNPDSIHIATMNAIMPFLSKADQQKLGFHLALALGEGGGLDAYNFIDGSSFYGEESWDDLIYDPTRWQNLFQTLVNLRDYFQDELGPNTVEAKNLIQLDWLINVVQRAKRMFSAGRMSGMELEQAKDQALQWFSEAEATGDRDNPNWAEGYGPLLKMIIEPYVSYLESPWKDIQEREGTQEYGR